MAKPPADPQAVALDALAQALADPAPRLLFGSAKTPSFFKGSTAPVKAAAKLSEERRWIEATGQFLGSGKSKKPSYRLTPTGLQAVLEHAEAPNLLRNLLGACQEQVKQFRCLGEQVGQLLEHRQRLTEVVSQLARKVEPPNVEQVLRQLQTSSSSPAPIAPTASAPDWLDEAVRLVGEQQQRDRYQPLTLPSIFARLKQKQPGLTLGQFHDGLRRLREQRRIRLSPFTRALATIEDPQNALFLDGEVMYYVELP